VLLIEKRLTEWECSGNNIMIHKDVEYKRGFNAGYGDHPDDAVYNDITPKDIATDEWNRGL
jgi:hypothetical protein